jgi:leucyl aminopeptidase (aminopeptidase T)
LKSVSERFRKAAELAVTKCASLRAGEKALVLADTGTDQRVIKAFSVAATVAGGVVSTVIFQKPEAAHTEPPPPVVAAMCKADAIFDVTTVHITLSKAYGKARDSGARILMMSGLPIKMFLHPAVLEIDIERLGRLTEKIVYLAFKAETCKITSALGTSFEMKFSKERPLRTCYCRVAGPGELNYMPSGAWYFAPIEETVRGTIVIDGSLYPPIGKLKTPVELIVDEGKIEKIKGKIEANRFQQWMSKLKDPNMFYIAHVGSGTNPKASLTGNIMIDERILGAVNVGIGNNMGVLKGLIRAKSHSDGIILRPSMYFDDDIIIKNGYYVHPSLQDCL